VTQATAPKLCAILIAGRCRGRSQRVLDALCAQSALASIEIVVVDLAAASSPPLELPKAAPLTYLRRPGIAHWGSARAEAVRTARAPVVAFIEDHCRPARDWAQALIEAHAGPWAAVGYAFTNANPRTFASRAGLLARYGLFAHPVASGPARYASGNNISYKRDALLALGARLEALLDIDFNLQEELRSQGLALYVEGRALAAHENYTSFAGECRAGRPYCRLLAAHRAEQGGWSAIRRTFYGVLTPFAAPALRLLRLASSLRSRPAHWPVFAVGLPWIAAMYVSDALGESAGYLLGAGRAASDVLTYELDTERDA